MIVRVLSSRRQKKNVVQVEFKTLGIKHQLQHAALNSAKNRLEASTMLCMTGNVGTNLRFVTCIHLMLIITYTI